MTPHQIRPIRLLTRRDMLALGAAAAVAPSIGWAQDFPAKPIRLMVGFASGGGVDLTARLLGPHLSEELKSSIVVENKSGASGMICSEYVARAQPDGYTLMFTGGSAVAIAPHLVAKPPINSLTDLAPINTIGASPLVISMHPSLGARNLQEFITLARTRKLTLGSAGTGSLTHLSIELLSQATGGNITHVPYKGGGPALVDALAGHVNGIVSDIPPVFQHYQEGRLVPVGITSEQRIDILPHVAPVNELVKGFSAASWFGFFAPAKTPQAIVDRMSAAILKVAAREDLRAQLKKAGVLPGAQPTPEAFRKFVAEESARWGKVVRDKGITMAS